MKVDKLILDSIERCYCAATLTAGGTQWLLLAGEAEGGPCYAYSVEDFSHREVVWEHGGGTMAIVQIPGRDGEFVAIQNFSPVSVRKPPSSSEASALKAESGRYPT